MKKKLLRIFFALIMFFSVLPTAHIYNNETKVNAVNTVTGGYLYFDNTKTNWSDSYIYFCIGHNSYTSLYKMTNISNTNLYYCKMDKWDNSTYYAIIGTSSSWGSGNWGTSNLKNANHYTTAYTSTYGLNSGSYYLFTPANSNNGCTLSISSLGTSTDSLKKNMTVEVYNKTGSSSDYTKGVTGGNVTLSGYYPDGNDKTGNSSSTTNSTANPITYGAIITSSFTYTANSADGYKFDGWYSSSSSTTALSNTNSYTTTVSGDTTIYAKFSEKSYTVTYNPGANATGSQMNGTIYHKTSSSLLGQTYERAGYTQDGWSTSDGGNKVYNLSQSISSTTNLTLYPHWQINTYTINYDLNNATVAPDNPSTYTIETNTFTLINPTRVGYSFIGWSGTNLNTITKNVEIQRGSTGNLEFTANWSLNSHDITLDVNGGNPLQTNKITIAYGSEYGTLTQETPKHPQSSFIFVGWFTENGLTNDGNWGEEILSSTIMNTDAPHTLYAKWEELNDYKLTLNPNGMFANVTPSSIQFYETLRYGYLEGLDEFPTPTRDGYVFDGWFTDQVGGNEVTANTTEHPDEDHSIYAHWIAKSYNITYDLGNGSVSTPNPSSYTTQSSNIVLNNPTREGYTFAGWTEAITSLTWYSGYINNDTGAYEAFNADDPDAHYSEKIPVKAGVTYVLSGTYLGNARWRLYDFEGNYVKQTSGHLSQTYTAPQDGYVSILLIDTTEEENRNNAIVTISTKNITAGISTGSLGNRKFTANWTPNVYTITLEGNGGTDGGTIDVTYDEKYPALGTSTLNGYSFTGWYTKEGELIQKGDTVKIIENTTLYAHWEAKTYYAILNDNYTGAPISDKLPVVYNSYFEDITIPSREGYRFLGYYTGAVNGTQVIDENGNGVVPWEWTSTEGNPKELYAHWEIIEYTITYNYQIDNISVSNKTKYTIETETFTLINPEKYGATFLGWTGTNGNTPSTNITITKGSTENRTYTAQWSGTITFHLDIKNINTATSTWGSIISGYSLRIYNGSSEYKEFEQPPYETRFTQIEGTKYEYYLELSTLGFNQTTDIVLYFYQDSTVKQTTKISLPLNINNLGGHYEVICPTSFDWSGDKINNVTQGEMSFVSYFLPDGTLLAKDYYTPDGKTLYYPIHIEKEGNKLEAWYTNTSLTSQFDAGVNILDGSELNLYAKYSPAEDYFLYIDTTQLTDWSVESVYFWNGYFRSHNNTWPGNMDAVTDLGNGIIQISVDASKSYTSLIVNDGAQNDAKQTVDITLTPQNVYYIVQNSTDGSGKYKVAVEKDLNNLMTAQKVNGDVNAFRFGAGLSNSIDNLSTSSKNFGYKFIFVDKDGNNGSPTSYVGYWNFSSSNMLDALRVGNILYLSEELDQSSSYQGYYALTLTDDVSFRYENYDQIVVIACYKDTSGNIQVIKAQEYNIEVDNEGVVTINTVQR